MTVMSNQRGRPKHAIHPLTPTPEAIRSVRIQARLSQEEAGFLAGVSARTWQRWESGQNGAEPAVWQRFLETVGQTDMSPPPPPPTSMEILGTRARLKLSQERASDLAGVSLAAWKSWESGRTEMHGAKWASWLKMAYA